MTTLATVTAGEGADTVVNQNTDSMSPAGMYGRRAPATSGLTWAYYGGRGFGNTIADSTVTLAASTTNYVVASRSTGAVSVSAVLTNWNDLTNYYRIYLIVTGTASVTSATDYRDFSPTAPGMTNPMTTAEDIIKGGSAGTPVRVGVGSNGQVLGIAAGAVGWITNPAGFSNPMTTSGDIITGSASGAPGRLGIGGTGDVLTVVAGVPAWSPPGIEQNIQSNAYSLLLTDKGKQILHPSADATARIWTIPANSSVAFPINTAVTFVNQNAAGIITIAIATDTMRLAGSGTTGSRTLAANGIATAVKITSTEWIISGTGLS